MSPRYSNVTSSIRGHDYTICITQSQFIYSNQYIEPQRVPKVSTEESRRKRVPTPMHRFMGGTRKLITKTYIKMNHVISHCHHRYARQDIHQVFSNLCRLNPIRLLQGENSIHYKREEGEKKHKIQL